MKVNVLVNYEFLYESQVKHKNIDLSLFRQPVNLGSCVLNMGEVDDSGKSDEIVLG